MSNDNQFVALVLAADRGERDAVAGYAGTVCKAYAPVAGKPMVIRVLDALKKSHKIASVLLCGPPQSLLSSCEALRHRIDNKQVKWVENRDSPARSAAYGAAQINPQQKILLTTADHALLTAEIVDYFLQASSNLVCDVTVGVVRHEVVQNRYGSAKRTVIRLQDGNYCGCNLFTFNTQGRVLVDFWQQAETLRKRPWKLISRILGWRAVWSYLLGCLTLEQALQQISMKTGVRVRPVILPFPDAGIDVDKVEDLLLVESILAQPGAAGHQV
ncbi:nucleotidyltransferase family protein [Nitrosomonas sp.]|uniref:nucleotidyltransferase family protein n=1 Tax=Nitrosomonas sp. TaxID=42353 RepID=UPI00260091B7|nr:nucleotidyltransferase family protein [Nitrosomonas sp.]MCC6916242.1 nucleotidyltransferase family protein [Nitrosomonas sp.]